MREPPKNGTPLSYDRPNQPWDCGLAQDGRACPAGPGASGVCPALAECTPRRDGDRWQCNRSTLRGGPCDDGPSHEGQCQRVNRCHPVRSLRTIRGRFVTASTLATAGALLVLLSANWRDEFISPGPLAQQHAQLLEQNDAPPNCAACHAAAKDGLAGWTASLLVGHGDAPPQSQLCMNCHEKTIAPELALAAHNLPPKHLQQRTAQKKGSELFSAGPRGPACATCHREHHGADFDLTAIDNASCQACHVQRYESFAADHPDFGVWPYERRTRIAFDHAAHQAKHFAEKRQPFDCRVCHTTDATQTGQLVAGFEQSCAACHDEKIFTSVGRGVPMLVLPTLDVDALRDAGHDIGPWPEDATGDFDGRLPAAMKLLLAADPAAAAAMATLGADFEFIDVDPDDPKQLDAVADLAAAIKQLLAELSQAGPEAVRTRLQTALGREISDAQLDALVAGLSVDTLRPAVAAWLPGTEVGSGNWSELQGSGFRVQATGSDMLLPEPRTPNPEPSFAPAGEWSRDDTTLSIRYRLAGHADPVFTEWLALLVETPGIDERPLESALLKELSKPTAPGLCVSCHSLEELSAGQLAINWHAFEPRDQPRTFTKFSHGPHLVLPQLADCTACHAIDTAADTTASYTDVDPHRFVSEFVPMSKRECAACHTAAAAGDSCQSCHRYHVD